MPSFPCGRAFLYWTPDLPCLVPFVGHYTTSLYAFCRLVLLTLENGLSLITLPPTDALLAGVGEAVHALGLHLDAVAGLGGGLVVAVLDDGGVQEVLVEVVDVLEDGALAADDDVVNGAQVLRVLGQADAARVGDDGDAVLLGHEQHGQHLVDAAHAAGVDLAHVDGARHDELLEDDAVLAHLARGDADAVGLEGLAHGLVAQDVVGRRGLLDEPRLELGELLHVGNGLGHAPDLVGVHHELVALVVADDVAGNGQAVLVLLEVAADLDLEVLVAVAQGLGQEGLHLVLAVAEPAGAGGVGGHGTAGQGVVDALGLAALDVAEEGQGLLRGNGVGDVAEVDAAHKLLGRHVGHDAPHGLAEHLGPEVPDGVDHGAEREVNDALFRSDPPQLAVVDQVAPRLAPVLDQRREGAALDAVRDVVDGCADNVIATANGEGLVKNVSCLVLDAGSCHAVVQSTHHAVSAELRVRLQNTVGRRVVTGSIHGIRTSLVQGRGKPHVPGGPASNGNFGHLCFLSRFLLQKFKVPGNL